MATDMLKAIAEAERFDGYFTLLTNRKKELLSMKDALTNYKKQWGIEKKFAFTKGPLGVEPFYLKRNDRLVGMVLVMALAMLILSLTERQARDAQQQKQQDFSAFYPQGRVTGPLTLSKILDTTSHLGIVKLSLDNQSSVHITNQTLSYQQILEVLGLTEPPADFFERIRQRNCSRTFRQWHFSNQTEKNIAGEKPPSNKVCQNSGM